MTDSTHVVCPACGGVNRLPVARLGSGGRCGRCKAALFDGRPVAVSESAFETQLTRSDLPLLVDFWAPWCGPCRAMAPAFEQAAATLEPKVRLLKVNTEEASGLAGRYAIRSIPTLGQSVGEVVFNTAMTGYQEILTDPSYSRQLVTLTYPHIGNTGVTEEDTESAAIHAAGLIVRDVPRRASNWRREHDLGDYLRAQGVPGIADIDTRRLTRILREKGAQNGCLMAGEGLDEAAALAAARAFPGLAGMDLAKEVTTPEAYTWTAGLWSLERGQGMPLATDDPALRFHVVAYDYGVKQNILRMLVHRGCRITVVPAATPAAEVLALRPDGVFLSNGPGDPEPCDYAISAIRSLLDAGIPQFGICLGHQLLGSPAARAPSR
jgi:carbamoyl-phosphate synthase small subunit